MTALVHNIHGAWTTGEKHGSGEILLSYSLSVPFLVRVRLSGLGLSMFVDRELMADGCASYTVQGDGSETAWLSKMRLHIQFTRGLEEPLKVTIRRGLAQAFLTEVDGVFDAAMEKWLRSLPAASDIPRRDLPEWMRRDGA